MPRTKKETVDYFPHDCDATGGKTCRVLQIKYGNDGYAFWFKLLEALGSTSGHFIHLESDADIEYLAARTGISATETVYSILTTLTTVGAIDRELFEVGVIWSQNFVDRLSEVYRKRREPVPEPPLYLLDHNDVSATETGNSGAEKAIPSQLYDKGKGRGGEGKEVLRKDEGEDRKIDERAAVVWGEAVEIIRNNVSRPNFRTWFEKVKPVRLDNETLIIDAGTPFAAEYLLKNQFSLLSRCVAEAADCDLKVFIEPRLEVGR